jgi:peroxiredoxin
MFRRACVFMSTKGKVGYTVPESQVFVGKPPKPTSTNDLFQGKKVFLFATPGAFTGNCSTMVPAIAEAASKLKSGLNVAEIYCVTSNDSFVCDNWLKDMKVGSDVTMISDPGHSLLNNLGHKIDLPVLGGDRYARVALVLEDGKITKVWKEKDGKAYEATAPDAILAKPNGTEDAA